MDEKTTPEKQIPNNQDRDHHVDLKEIREGFYKIRKFEIQNLWQRSIFLATFTVILFTGYGSLVEKLISYDEYQSITAHIICCLLTFLGSIFSIIWIMMAKGSKAWFEIYERRIIDIESEPTLRIPQKFQMSKGAPWSRNDSLWSLEPGAYSVSKINILLGQVLRVTWLIAFIIHIVLLAILLFYLNFDHTTYNTLLYIITPVVLLISVMTIIQFCITSFLKYIARSKSIKRPKNNKATNSTSCASSSNAPAPQPSTSTE